jgi:hypothetical protein
MTAAMAVNGAVLALAHKCAPGVETNKECCEFTAQSPPPAEGQADGQAR